MVPARPSVTEELMNVKHPMLQLFLHLFKYPTTYAIIDASEVFLETPSYLKMQSLTWSSYKHHNTAKFLVACTPNGNISYVSPLHARSKSDVELTCVSAFLDTLKTKPGVSNMADRGFTIQDWLKPLVNLNIPPFMKGRKQLPGEEVLKEDMQLLCMLQ